jgi:hypothetical protein
MPKVEMLDLDGNVVEVCEATSEKLAVEFDDEGAFCEDGEFNPGNCSGDVYRWTTKDRMTFQACAGHIALDDFARFAS